MKKIIFLIVSGIILAILAVLFIIPHLGHENLTTINPGLYEVKFTLNSGGRESELKMRVRYHPNGVYAGKIYINNTPVQELKGRFKVEDGKLKSFDKFVRTPQKDGSWSPWKSEEPSSVSIRNITKDSYQYYFNVPDKIPDKKEGTQYATMGIKEGWKTYKRIRP